MVDLSRAMFVYHYYTNIEDTIPERYDGSMTVLYVIDDLTSDVDHLLGLMVGRDV